MNTYSEFKEFLDVYLRCHPNLTGDFLFRICSRLGTELTNGEVWVLVEIYNKPRTYYAITCTSEDKFLITLMVNSTEVLEKILHSLLIGGHSPVEGSLPGLRFTPVLSSLYEVDLI